ncbi:MAG TPA: DUF3048 domain-containing protein [Actinomycetota bacterium]|nr:DUF3048 domain-containing protein [Actinomycetota bacterium]
MALSTRGRTLVSVLVVVVLAAGAFVGWSMFTRQPGETLTQAVNPFDDSPPVCALTGQEARGEGLAGRRALAVKIENSPESRPQAGLDQADIVFEQEAEGGISRFIAVYQCQNANRLGPIRSARPVDPLILQQFGRVLFVHAGSVQAVINAIERAGIQDINCNFREDVCPRDPTRTAPHDVFTSTKDLYAAGGRKTDAPEPLFTFEEDLDRAGTKRGREIHLEFSPVANVFWSYDPSEDVYLRSHDTTPHALEDGTQVSARNVVVMLVRRVDTNIVDAAGTPVPSFKVSGQGRAYVFRDGRVIQGQWRRPNPEETLTLVTRQGDEIPLAPGTTWVELFPTDAPAPLEFS